MTAYKPTMTAEEQAAWERALMDGSLFSSCGDRATQIRAVIEAARPRMLTYEEIAECVGISKQRVYEIVRAEGIER